MKEKVCIAVIKFGDNPMYDVSLFSIRGYADRYKIELVVIESKKLTLTHHTDIPHIEKFQIRDLFLQGYDRVLFLDLDILISPTAPNIFESYPKGTWIYNEGDLDFAEADALYFESEFNVIFPTIDGRKRVLNTGVMLLDNSTLPTLFDYEPSDFKRSFAEGTIGGEQTYFNMLLCRNEDTVNILNSRWNCLVYTYGIKDNALIREQAYFLHYAGRGEDKLIFDDARNLWK